MGVSKHFGAKNDTRRNNKIHKDRELYQVFIHNFLCQNFQIFPLHILLTIRIRAFWSKGIDQFWSGGIETFWARKIIEENQQNSDF